MWIKTNVIPNFVIGMMAKFNAPMKVLNSMIGFHYHISNKRAVEDLGWNPRSAKETVMDAAKLLSEAL